MTTDVQHEEGACPGLFTAVDGGEITPPYQALGARQHTRTGALMLIGEDGQTMPPLLPARPQNIAAIQSPHSRAETVDTQAAAILGLECAFHRDYSFFSYFQGPEQGSGLSDKKTRAL